ncbi:hypothetical protein B0G69_6505 [Paraburkholderia sp. RAU2J]|uniref:hypothetical protein n=1 Tax=Paraburkholderia sp. RAU2J TaxID=1938810 RepID=UPI000F24A329|nr:hypothetical protein [Paraburkholderia sp. RAU2J]RKT13364.1 hypothetical protein B0G69_6505 [Paraburkholderia sp. RAU2J]
MKLHIDVTQFPGRLTAVQLAVDSAPAEPYHCASYWPRYSRKRLELICDMLLQRQFKPGSGPAPDVEVNETPRRFEASDNVRTKEGSLAHVGYYDGRGEVGVNVVEAAEYREDELTPPLL